MGLKLTGLVQLYQDMITNKKTGCQFKFKFNNVQFDVMFFIDENPYVLMFGVLKENFYFESNVSDKFEINTYIGDKFHTLCKILGLQYDPKNPFKTNAFFSEFNRQIPQNIRLTNDVKPHHVAVYKKMEVEEGDKIYFFGWLYHGNNGSGYSPENLKKTKRILRNEAYERCKKKNISSRWTADFSKMVEYYLPK